MRVGFVPLSVDEVGRFIAPRGKRGGALGDITVFDRRHLRGGGILSFLTGLARRATPFLLKTIMPAALTMGQNVLQDINAGQGTLKDSIRKRGMETLKSIGPKLLAGGRITKRKTKRPAYIKKMDRYKDVFS